MITITERAAAFINKQLAKCNIPEAMVRFGVKGGGCTGFSYIFDFTSQKQDTDHLFEKDGVKIIVDPKSFIYLDGTEVDFETGIQGHGLHFKNPNVKDNCGCGKSILF